MAATRVYNLRLEAIGVRSLSPNLQPRPIRTPADSLRTLLAQSAALGVPLDYARMHALRRFKEPLHVAFVGLDYAERPQWLAPRAARAWFRMHDAAAMDGINLQLVSAFRSVEYQIGIIERKRGRGLTIEEILRVNAAPGYSEHHSGRAIDLTTPGFEILHESFENSEAFAWLTEHGKAYRFYLSYPRANRHGIAYEPWHWCWHARVTPTTVPAR